MLAFQHISNYPVSSWIFFLLPGLSGIWPDIKIYYYPAHIYPHYSLTHLVNSSHTSTVNPSLKSQPSAFLSHTPLPLIFFFHADFTFCFGAITFSFVSLTARLSRLHFSNLSTTLQPHTFKHYNLRRQGTLLFFWPQICHHFKSGFTL